MPKFAMQSLIKAISDFESSTTHDSFRALLEHKANLLMKACATLGGNEYKTSDGLEAIFLLDYLFDSSLYCEIDVVIQNTKNRGALLASQWSFTGNLFNLSSRAADGGKDVRLLFGLTDWVQALADVDSSRMMTDLLLHKVKVALAPKEDTINFPNNMLAVFHGQNQPSCICSFLIDSAQSESQSLTISYDLTDTNSYTDIFQSAWKLESVRHAKVL
jgi:hypothetical protein